MRKKLKGYNPCVGCFNILGGGAPIISGSGVCHLEATDWQNSEGMPIRSIWIKYCFVCGKNLKGKLLQECALEGCTREFVVPSNGLPQKYCCTSHRVSAWQRRKRELKC